MDVAESLGVDGESHAVPAACGTQRQGRCAIVQSLPPALARGPRSLICLLLLRLPHPAAPPPCPPPLAAALGIGSRYNKSRVGIWVKLGASLALTALVWEVKPIFYGIWRPFTFAMGYDDPRRPSGDLLRGEVGHSPPAPPPPPFGVQCDPLRPNAASAAVD